MTTPVKLGAHMPTAGGLHLALLRGKEIGCETVQIFTKSPQQWRASPFRNEVVESYQRALGETGICPVVAHSAYLINLACPNPALLETSRKAFVEEMERAARLNVSYMVTHLGSHCGAGEICGLNVLAESLRLMLDATEHLPVDIALETTAGQGTSLGYRFEHLAEVMEALAWHPRLRVCIDTCHLFAAGYDLRTPQMYNQTMKALENNVGKGRVALIHANDSQKPLGSRVDRHAHIGQGGIGEGGFRNLLRDRRWKGVSVIIETPEAPKMHEANLRRLREFVANG